MVRCGSLQMQKLGSLYIVSYPIHTPPPKQKSREKERVYKQTNHLFLVTCMNYAYKSKYQKTIQAHETRYTLWAQSRSVCVNALPFTRRLWRVAGEGGAWRGRSRFELAARITQFGARSAFTTERNKTRDRGRSERQVREETTRV